MTKRKIMLLALSLCMVGILAVGGTLAYFTSEDNADNVFTIGYVDIDLEEKFDEENADLVPGLDIEKQVWVSNTGSNDAYVRVHIAIPSELDDGNPTFAAVNNFVHFNFTSDSVADGQWSWGNDAEAKNYPGTGSDEWNFYVETIDDVEYNVYVVTYTSVLAAGSETATKAMTNVYLDPSVNAALNEEGDIVYTDNKGNVVTMTPNEDGKCSLMIKVWAEATQVETFDNAFTALNTAFGVPGTYSPWTE